MRLKSIKLAGFKSFVDPTTVPFSTNMTAIVGPNGCGKSNIIDAVRWVMGESSAKNLRGESMTDVIFNGATGRQPVGQASIELIFDNTSGKLAGEYAAFTEISIKRKVTREGVSQYFLNGSKCRRRDVTDIFLGTGMGPRSYAIIEQGMIARLIESKPEELRVYLEEAAGISKYKERRRETENRMRRTQENLDRLTDIREELGKQLQHLKRQANAAEKYAEFKKEERLLSAKLHYIYWKLLDTDLSGKSNLAIQFEKEIEDAVIAKNTNENVVDALKTSIEEKQEVFNRLQAKFYESGAEIATVEQKLKYEKSRQAEQSHQLSRLDEELKEIARVIQTDLETLEIAKEELETSNEEIFVLEESLEASNIKQEEEEAQLSNWQDRWETFNRNSADTQKTAEIEQAKIQDYENRLSMLEKRKVRLTEEKGELSVQLAQIDVSQWEEDQLVVEEKIADIQLEIDKLNPEIEAKQLEIDNFYRERSELSESVSSKKAILASLLTLQESFTKNDAEELSSWEESNNLSSKERLIDKLVADDEWELAVQHVLQDWLNAYVLDSDDLGVIDLHKSPTTVALLEGASDGSSSMIREENTLASVIKGAESLTPLLNKVHLSDTESEALAQLKELPTDHSIILPNGLWISRSWRRLFRPDASQEGALARSKDIKKLNEEIPVLLEKLELSEKGIVTAKNEFEALKEALNQHEKVYSVANQELNKVISLRAADQAKLDQFQLRRERVEEELSEISISFEDAEELLATSRHIWQESLGSLEDLNEQKNNFLDEKTRLLESLEIARRSARDSQTAYHQKKLDCTQKQNQLASVQQTIERLEKEKRNKEERKFELSNREGLDTEEIETLTLTLEGLLETRIDAETKLNQSKVELENVSKELRIEEDKRLKLDSALQSAREKLESIRMDSQALAINKKNLEERILEDGFDPVALAEQITEEDDEPQLKERLEQLANRIQRLGSINLAAIDEFKVQNERKEHLDSQNDELVDALNTLVDAIKKIDRETRARFKETFDQVNEGLQRLFPKIFGGGNAYLELTDDNLLETGVMIIARPPGKKNATIQLLSGGEKSLTAIALIFAIFELNPAPFCMLDEVDAPLDDANVGRFANMVKEMSSRVQFIYISHNKVSMEKADHLMGVTMHEPGVSRLVSVDVDEAAALVES